MEVRGHKLTVKEPAKVVRSAVLVTGLSTSTDRDKFELYFSHPKRSGGDEIVELKYFEPQSGYAVIIFCNEKGQYFIFLTGTGYKAGEGKHNGIVGNGNFCNNHVIDLCTRLNYKI